jgi:hypothetical protein
MAKFVAGEPVETTASAVAVDAGLPAGKHVFTLVVEDDEGNRSQPARASVTIVGQVDGEPRAP